MIPIKQMLFDIAISFIYLISKYGYCLFILSACLEVEQVQTGSDMIASQQVKGMDGTEHISA